MVFLPTSILLFYFAAVLGVEVVVVVVAQQVPTCLINSSVSSSDLRCARTQQVVTQLAVTGTPCLRDLPEHTAILL